MTMKRISEGAEAQIFSISVFGADAVLKFRNRKHYRVAKLDEEIRGLRTRSEARVMKRLADNKVPAPRVIAVGKFSIYMEMLAGKMLKDAKITVSDAADAGSILAGMHNCGVVHGDFTPANLMRTHKGMFVIDFGLSEVSNSMEERALDVLLMKRSLDKKLYPGFERSYASRCRDAKTVLARLAEIERRGRYQTRTLT